MIESRSDKTAASLLVASASAFACEGTKKPPAMRVEAKRLHHNHLPFRIEMFKSLCRKER